MLLAACTRHASAPPHSLRVVSLAPGITEMLFYCGCGSHSVGTDDFSDYPPAAKALPKVGRMQPDLEKIAQLAPDVVIGITAGPHPKLRGALDSLHIPLLLMRTDHLADIPSGMTRLTRMLGCEGGEARVSVWRHDLEAQRRIRSASPRVVYVTWVNPIYAAGRATYVDELLELTGAKNAVSATGWPQLSIESLIASPADLLLYPAKTIPAAEAQHLVAAGVARKAIPVEDALFGRPGPRLVETARILNGIFDQQSSVAAPISPHVSSAGPVPHSTSR